MRYQQSTMVLLAGVVACGDPAAPTRSVTLSFCSGTSWVGVQNEGRGWVTIADRPGDFTADATERLVVATITSGNNPELAFYYLTRDQAQATFVCSTPPGGKQLSGAVAGTSGGLTQIAMGGSVAITSSSGFTLRHLPDGPLDLVAVHAGSAIVRRRVSYPDGATIPVLDFSSADAFALQSHTLTVEPTGLGAAFWETVIMTSGGTNGPLTRQGCCSGGNIYTLPASRQENGDLYHLMVSSGSVGLSRRVDRFYEAPSNQTVVFGPAASGATLTAAGGEPWLSRVDIPSQPEYGSQIELVVGAPQPSTNTTTLAIRASKEYFRGTPGTWSFTVPDLSGVAGFPTGWPKMPATGGWQFTASSAPWLFSASSARAGDEYRSAIASNR